MLNIEEALKDGLITVEEYNKILEKIEIREKYEYLARRSKEWQKYWQD